MCGRLLFMVSYETRSDLIREQVISGNWNIMPNITESFRLRLIILEIPNTALISGVEKLKPNLITAGRIHSKQKITPVINKVLDIRVIDLMKWRSFSYNPGRIKFQICLARYGEVISKVVMKEIFICKTKTSNGEKKFSAIGEFAKRIFIRKSSSCGDTHRVMGKTAPNALKQRISVWRRSCKCDVISLVLFCISRLFVV